MNERKYKVETEELKKVESYLSNNLVDIEAKQLVTKVREEEIRCFDCFQGICSN